MAEAVGLVASIATLLQVSTTVVGYVTDVKDASKERKRLLDELSSTSCFLYMLQGRAVQAEAGKGEHLDTIRSLNLPNGPLAQFKSALERLVKKLAPTVGLMKGVGKALAWPFKKDEIKDILGVIERSKTHFTLALQGESLELSRAIKSDIAGITERVEQLQIVQIDTQREDALRWLETVDPSLNHNAACKKHEPQTGEWFLISREFNNWKVSQNSILWLYGIPGCGKTVLSSTIVEHMKGFCEAGPSNALAYFYFDFNERKKQNVKNMLRSVIAQFSREGATLPGAVQTLLQYKGKAQEPNEQTLVQTLSSVFKEGGEYYVILDALDECAERENLLKIVSELASHGRSNLHMLFTSRREQDIKEELDHIATEAVPIQNAKVDKDITLHVRRCLEEDRKLKKWPDSIKHEIETSLVEGAHGMFRWVFCQLETLKACITKPALRLALKQLPKTLDETYERILRSVPEGHFEQVYSILQWLAFSERPLFLEEVAEAAIMRSASYDLDLENRLIDPEDVLRICSSLVTHVHVHVHVHNIWGNVSVVDEGEKDETLSELPTGTETRRRTQVRFAHFSVKEYIVSERIRSTGASKFSVSEITSHTNLGNFCLSYLLLLDQYETLSEEQLAEYPLHEYSAEHWYEHVKHLEYNKLDITETMTLVSKLLNPSEGFAFINWLRISEPDNGNHGQKSLHRKFNQAAPLLYYAALLGLPTATGMLLQNGSGVNAQGGDLGNALQAASSGGHQDIVRLLIEKGADVNAQGGRHGNALQAAASWRGTEAIVRLLIEKGADVNAQGGYYGNALQAASWGGTEAIVRLLIEKGADVNAQGGEYGNALQAASSGGHQDIVRLLIEKGADVNAQGGRHGNALQAASWRGTEAIVRLLIEKGADVNAQGGYCGNALQAASKSGTEAIVRLLIEKGADVNAQGGYYGNALQAASLSGTEAIVRLLIEKGADVNAQGGYHGNALQAASKSGTEAIVRLLIEKGADVNAQGGNHSNAFQVVTLGSHEDIFRLFIEEGADANARGGNFGNALQAASWRGHEDIVRLLIEKGADVNAQGGEYGNALQAASTSESGNEDIVRLLIEKGADVNAQGGRYGNALQAASWSGHEDIVRLLLEKGADVNARGGKYGNALQAASWSGHEDIVRLLLEKGADVNAQGGEYGNALQAASTSESGNEDIVRLLIEKGADVNAQ
ncbi:MAG: hypothetical protein M1816_003022, partial [Peltula sp. TS41687]